MIVETIFWLIVVLIVYVYIGYPFLLFLLNQLCAAPPVQKANITPTVSLIIASYNEEKIIRKKIENCLALNYPKKKLEIMVASDGSTDRTNEFVRTFEGRGVKLVTLNSNRGKSSVQNRAVEGALGDILLFSDADVMLHPEAVSRVIRNFADEKVGCVIGKITYLNLSHTSVSEGEMVYWSYEKLLRSKESELGNFVMGSGFMAIRRKLFHPLNTHVGEDFVLPLRAAMSGYRVVYEPEAVSETILYQTGVRTMLRSKVRVITKDLRGLFLYREILNPIRYPLYAWGLVSHKFLRWIVSYFLIALFALNLLLLDHPFYRLILALQIVFYVTAIIGYLWQRKDKPPHIFGLPFSFCLVNLAALVGVAQFLMGKKSGRWEPVRS